MTTQQEINKFIYLPIYLSDYVSQSRKLTMLQRGAFIDLSVLYFQENLKLNYAKEQIYRMVFAFEKEEKEAVDFILDNYFIKSENKPIGFSWVSNQLNEIGDKVLKKLNASRENGKKGGRGNKSENKPTGYNSLNLEKTILNESKLNETKLNENNPKITPNLTPNLTPKKPQDNPKITPNVNDNVNQECKLESINHNHNSKTEANLDFQEFWDHYTPVECNGRVVGKDSKKTAEEKYRKVRTQHNHDVIMLKLQQYLTYCKKNSILTKAVHRWLTTTDFSDTEQEQAIIADRPFAIASKQDIQQQQNHQAFANFLSKQND